MDRAEMLRFCTMARCEIEGIEDAEEMVGVAVDYSFDSSEELLHEVDFLEDMLGK